MVDRYKSIFQPSSPSAPLQPLLAPSRPQTGQSASRMRDLIKQYRLATTPQQQSSILHQFQSAQQSFRRQRRLLAQQYQSLSDGNAQKMVVKEQLLLTVQKQLQLDVEMNQLIEQKRKKLGRENDKGKYSARLQNAIADLQQKQQQIAYIGEQVRECMQLMQLIGLIVVENGEKIAMSLEDVKKAKEEVDKAVKIIDKVRMDQARRRKKMCVVIVLGLVVVVVGLAVLGVIVWGKV